MAAINALLQLILNATSGVVIAILAFFITIAHIIIGFLSGLINFVPH